MATSDLPTVEKTRLLTERRATSTTFVHPRVGTVTIRDQAPLREQFLVKSLTDLTVVEWLERLNNRVFFWLHPDKLDRLLSARLYRTRRQDVITVDTRRLLDAYPDDVRLSPINSGATLYPSAVARGSHTFVPLDRFPFEERRKGRKLSEVVAELAVIGGVPDLLKHVVGVDRHQDGRVVERLYPVSAASSS